MLNNAVLFPKGFPNSPATLDVAGLMGFSADNYFSGKGYLNNIDLNTLKNNGVYYSASGVSNIPASGFNGMIVVFNFSQFVAQVAFNAYTGAAYIRANLYGSGGWNTWSSWHQV